MLSRSVTYALTLFLIITLLLGYVLFSFSNSDKRRYQKILALSQPYTYAPDAVHKSTQSHVEGQKDLFYTNDKGQRLHLHLTSASSEMIVHNSATDSVVIEHLHDVACTLQELLYFIDAEGNEYLAAGPALFIPRKQPNATPIRLDPSSLSPWQRYRSFIAKEAVYNYDTHELDATDVDLAVYTTDSHLLPTSGQEKATLMTGSTHSLSCFWSEGKLNLKAGRLNATFYTLEEELW